MIARIYKRNYCYGVCATLLISFSACGKVNFAAKQPTPKPTVIYNAPDAADSSNIDPTIVPTEVVSPAVSPTATIIVECSSEGAAEHRTRFQAPSVPLGATCVQEEQTRKCENGNFTNWSGTYAQEACVSVSGTKVGSACASGSTYIESEDKCSKMSDTQVTLISEWITNSGCNDHYGVVNFTLLPIVAGKVQVKAVVSNYGPNWEAQKNCREYATKDWGILDLKATDGRDISSITTVGSLTFDYSSWGDGCEAKSGTTADIKSMLSLCDKPGEQYPTIKLRANGTSSVRMLVKEGAACPAGQTRLKGDCYTINN